ncbi:TBC1 domain family member 30 [Hypsibius exemplaris]|uniref:TBC1 domain family member 30 n=1 Tax=Hypsibius exemplaris TaxID=2072580 RepID=A0A9X6NM00_HYPEX|nr:TBC1 domain family member 30 [Hypsibius exemplaris]
MEDPIVAELSLQHIVEDDDDVATWEEFMLARRGYQESSRSRLSSTGTTTDLDGCSISRRASSSLDATNGDTENDADHADADSAYGVFQFVDSATDSGQTSDNDSRRYSQDHTPRRKSNHAAPSARKLMVANLLNEIYGPDHADEYSDDLEETRNLVRRTSTASQTSNSGKTAHGHHAHHGLVDYTSWRLEKYSALSQTLQKQGYQGTDRLDQTTLQSMDNKALRSLLASYEKTTDTVSHYLVQELKRKDYRQICQSKHCLIVSAALNALTTGSPKHNESNRIRFSIAPPPGDGYLHWVDGMRAVLRLPGGLPTAFRKTMWTTIANRYISQLAFDWEKVKRLLLHDRSNPDEEALGIQILKDLHRTGVTDYCGDHNDRERNLLKRVLLAYARFRPSVGYCQGFNIIAAVILDVVDKDEEEALKIMIYLIEHVLPPNYFANDLEALSVDLCVFQELTQSFMPELSQHLDALRRYSMEERGANGGYEPPLTNLFTIQWFLTLYATCLPQESTLRVWDCVFLYGSAILMKTSLALLRRLEKYFLPMETAFDFYSIMSELQQRMLEGALFGPEDIIQEVFAGPEFDLRALRMKHCNSPHDLRPALKTYRSLNSPNSLSESPEARLIGGFGRRRANSANKFMERRSSSADAEIDLVNLKKKVEEQKKEQLRATVSHNTTAVLKESIASRRGSLFVEPSPLLAMLAASKMQHRSHPNSPDGAVPFKFPLAQTESVCRIGDNYIVTSPPSPVVSPLRKSSRDNRVQKLQVAD